MNKFLASLLAGAFALSLGTASFAADAGKPAEPAKVEAVKAAEPVNAEAAKPVAETKVAPTKKHAKKHAKKATDKIAPTPATPVAPASK